MDIIPPKGPEKSLVKGSRNLYPTMDLELSQIKLSITIKVQDPSFNIIAHDNMTLKKSRNLVVKEVHFVIIIACL